MYYGVGFTHSDLYSMPIYLRNFYYKQLTKTKSDERKQVKQAQQRSRTRPKMKPVINPRFKR